MKAVKAAFIPVFLLVFLQIIVSVILTQISTGCFVCGSPTSLYSLWILGSTILIFFLIGYYPIKRYNFEFSEAVFTGLFAVFFFLIAEIPMILIYPTNAFGWYHRPSADLISSLYDVLITLVINLPHLLLSSMMCTTILLFSILLGANTAIQQKIEVSNRPRISEEIKEIIGDMMEESKRKHKSNRTGLIHLYTPRMLT